MKLSILISSYNRLPLFRRTLWSIANRPPYCDFEVIVADDGSTEDTLGELKSHSSRFLWKFIRIDYKEFEEFTGLTKFHNNPAWSNNVAFRHSSGDMICQQGNEVIAWDKVYNNLLGTMCVVTSGMVFSTTYDLFPQALNQLDKYGSNLTQNMVEQAKQFPLQSNSYRSDVTNYISMTPRTTWDKIGGYDERYFGGIAAEDSDFVRRARKLDFFDVSVNSFGISLHQSHGGKTCYYDPPASLITKQRWAEGCAINRAIYDNWDGQAMNPQRWPIGEIGVKEVITNG